MAGISKPSAVAISLLAERDTRVDRPQREPSQHIVLLSYVAIAVGGDKNPPGWRRALPSICLGQGKD